MSSPGDLALRLADTYRAIDTTGYKARRAYLDHMLGELTIEEVAAIDRAHAQAVDAHLSAIAAVAALEVSV